MKLAVCIPSRGMMHARTMRDILREVEPIARRPEHRVDLYFSIGKPQPAAQNDLVEQAFNVLPYKRPDYLWFFDDDMLIPKGTFSQLYEKVEQGYEIVAAHYPVDKEGVHDALHIRNGKFESAGMGCVLVRAAVLEELGAPYFRCDTEYVWNGEKLEPHPVPPTRDPAMVHGLHDVDFFQRLLTLGKRVGIIEQPCGQYNLVDANIKKYGNHTHQNVEEWRFAS